jgi:hypothetical protein
VPLLSRNWLLDVTNIELSHEHLSFEDGKSRADIGFGRHGLFSGVDRWRIQTTDAGYNDCIMRIAVSEVVTPSFYCLTGPNCQDWATAVRTRYRAIKDLPYIKAQCCGRK